MLKGLVLWQMNTRGPSWKNNTAMIQLSMQGSPLFMPQRLMFSLGAINNFLFPLPRKVHLHRRSQCLPSYLLLRPFNLTWANLSCSIKRGNRIPQEHRRLCLRYAIPILPPPQSLNTLSLRAERKSPASHESSTVTGVRWFWDHTEDHKSLFSLLPLPSLLAGDERGGMAL